MHYVDLRYTKAELLLLFDQATQEDVDRGGHYDCRGGAIYIWSHPWTTAAAYSQNIRIRLSIGGYAPYHRCTAPCLPASCHGYSQAIGTMTTTGERRWIGNTCSRISLGPSTRNCCCATNIW